MQPTTDNSAIRQKTKELCQAILDQPNMASVRQRINAFMGDEQARAQYDGLVAKGQALQEKQQSSVPLTSEEIDDFQQHRDAVLSNPVARNYIDAQEALHEVQHDIHRFLNKTLELGRVPTDDDFAEDGCCGAHEHGGCGCH